MTYENRLGEDGTFGDERVLVPSERIDDPTAVVPVDLDGDGARDVLSVSNSDNKVAWFENRLATEGRFSPQILIDTWRVSDLQDVGAADIDRDGDPDVVAPVGSQDGQLVWYENQLGETGDFSDPRVIEDDVAFAGQSIATPDADGDGAPDVFVAGATAITWYENQLGSGGGFSERRALSQGVSSERAIQATDLTGDGTMDIVTVSAGGGEEDGRVAWFENRLSDGEGFSDPKLISEERTEYQHVRAGDLNGDGNPEVIATSWSFSEGDAILWYDNQLGAEGGFSAPKVLEAGVGLITPGPIHLEDLSGDGAPDIIANYEPISAGARSTIGWFENQLGGDSSGGAPFSNAKTITSGDIGLVQSLQSADLNRDGAPEVLAASADDKIVWYEGIVEGAFDQEPEDPVAADTSNVDGSSVDPGTPIELGDTGTAIGFSEETEGSGTLAVSRFDRRPEGGGVDQNNLGRYRIEISVVEGDLSLGDSTEVRFAVDNLPGIEDPSQVTILKRETPGTGSFAELDTHVDDGGTDSLSDDELVAIVEGFSEFAFASDTEPLPVEMAGFEGTTIESGVHLTWQTASETNNAGFEVQRKAPGEPAAAWQEVGFVESRADGGTTREPRRYRFTDEDIPFETDELRYRLRQVDLGGTESLTEPVSVERKVAEMMLRKTFPNPARGQATVQFAVPESQDVTLRMYDVLGRTVRTVHQGKTEGRQELQMDLSGLASGTYFLRLSADRQAQTQKLTIIR